MSGCSLPVVINSGSGNQGITVTMPIVIYGRAWQADRELILRALVLANLISVHQKKYIGSLSAYCGATSAATGACLRRGLYDAPPEGGAGADLSDPLRHHHQQHRDPGRHGVRRGQSQLCGQDRPGGGERP